MNSEKLVSYEISSEEEETDQQEEVQDDSVGTKRSYECTFCRRGFTNAQALGGHMNIHRKDRAKAKKVTTHTSFSLPTNRFTNEESMAPPFTSEISDQPTRHYSILESERNQDLYFHPSSAPPNRRNQPPAYYAFEHEVHNPTTSRLMNTNQELQGANLSLQIGSSHVGNDTNQVRRGTQGDNEVDLELRLGHDPY